MIKIPFITGDLVFISRLALQNQQKVSK